MKRKKFGWNEADGSMRYISMPFWVYRAIQREGYQNYCETEVVAFVAFGVGACLIFIIMAPLIL